MATLSASHRARGVSHFDFKTSTSGVATKAMKNELAHLVASIQDPNRKKAFDTEMQSFFLLFTRYLAEKAQAKGL
jgi:UTP--glucose-1-phosphate uridylyltransferase